MSKPKRLLFLSMVALAVTASADALDLLVSFSTPGPDRYADGKPALDGEWYALVWSQDGDFNGIRTNGTPVDSQDQVVMMARLAKDAHCANTVFQIDSKVSKANGYYAVYLLDTRDPTRRFAASADENGKPQFLNGSQAVGRYSATASSGSKAKAVTEAWTASDASQAGDAESLKITAFRVDGAKVSLTVTGMTGGVQYNVLAGESVNAMTGYALEIPKTVEDNDVTFTMDASSAKFFKIVREPLVR